MLSYLVHSFNNAEQLSITKHAGNCYLRIAKYSDMDCLGLAHGPRVCPARGKSPSKNVTTDHRVIAAAAAAAAAATRDVTVPHSQYNGIHY